MDDDATLILGFPVFWKSLHSDRFFERGETPRLLWGLAGRCAILYHSDVMRM
jgi:hypothetical protein